MANNTTSQVTSIFGKRLREARQSAGIAQDKLGVMIGLDEGSASARMSRYESGIHEPPISTSIKIADALDVPLAYLYCDDDLIAALILAASKVSDRTQITNVINSLVKNAR